MKYYPSSLEFIGKYHQKYGAVLDFSKAGGAVELVEHGLIKYYLPLASRDDFYLTPHSDPEWKDPNKYKAAIEVSKKNQ